MINGLRKKMIHVQKMILPYGGTKKKEATNKVTLKVRTAHSHCNNQKKKKKKKEAKNKVTLKVRKAHPHCNNQKKKKKKNSTLYSHC